MRADFAPFGVSLPHGTRGSFVWFSFVAAWSARPQPAIEGRAGTQDAVDAPRRRSLRRAGAMSVRAGFRSGTVVRELDPRSTACFDEQVNEGRNSFTA